MEGIDETPICEVCKNASSSGARKVEWEFKERGSSVDKQLKTIEHSTTACTGKPRRKFIIEPAILLFHMFHLTANSIGNQYVYEAIADRLNLSGAENALERERNGSTVDGPCGLELNESSELYKLHREALLETATFLTVMDQVGGIPVVFIVLFFGTFMDRLGRRFALIMPVVGAIIKHGLYVLQQIAGLPLEILWVACFLEACFGGNPTFFAACNTYFADTLPEKTRSRHLILADASFVLSFGVVELFIEFYIEAWGLTWPYVMAIGGLTINLLYLILYVPEPHRCKAKYRDISPKYIIETFSVLTKKRPNNGRLLFLIYVTAWALLGFGIAGHSALEAFHLIDSPFCWTASMARLFDIGALLITGISQIFVAITLLELIGDSITLVLCCTSYILGNTVFILSTQHWQVYIVPFFHFAVGAMGPIMRSTLSNFVTAEEQGSMFALAATIEHICYIEGLAMSYLVYAATIDLFRGTVFIVMLGFVAISIATLLIFLKLQKKEGKKVLQEVENEIYLTQL